MERGKEGRKEAGKGGEGLDNLNFFPRLQTFAHPDCDCAILQGLCSFLPPAIWDLLTQLPTAPSFLLHPSLLYLTLSYPRV